MDTIFTSLIGLAVGAVGGWFAKRFNVKIPGVPSTPAPPPVPPPPPLPDAGGDPVVAAVLKLIVGIRQKQQLETVLKDAQPVLEAVLKLLSEKKPA